MPLPDQNLAQPRERLFFHECKAGIAWSHNRNKHEWVGSRVCRAMHLARQCYGDIASFQTGDDAVTLMIFGLTRDDCPGVLATGMDMRGYFLAGMGVPNDNRRVRRFQNNRPNWLPIRWANKIGNQKYPRCDFHVLPP